MAVAFDVAIIGGGLAGCSAAIALARAGRRVVVLESQTYPHHKVCGEFLSPESAELFASLGVADGLNHLAPVDLHTIEITTPAGLIWRTTLDRPAIGISRYTLDTLLAATAREAGVDLREATTAYGVRGSLTEGFCLEARSGGRGAEVRARVVLAAHGKRSVLDRALDRRFLRQATSFVGLKTHFYGPPLPGKLQLHSFSGGYCGVSEVEGGQFNLCMLIEEQALKRAGAAPQTPAFRRWLALQNPVLGEWLTEAAPVRERWLAIAQVSFARKPQVEGDVLMAGNSAGLIAPVAGDGMSMALAGGLMAAERLEAFLAGKLTVTQLKQSYTAQWRRAFASRLRLSRMLQFLMLRPHLLAPGLHAVKAAPSLGDFLIAQTRGNPLPTLEEKLV